MTDPATQKTGMNRRSVLKGTAALGTGLVIGFALPMKGAMAQAGGGMPKNYPPAGYVRISPEGWVTVISKHTEMGQGVYTGLATILADEMDADWSKVRVVSAPVDLELYAHQMLGLQGTGGSMSMSNSWEQYRTVGATARAMLVAAAAREWDVPESEITVSNGVVSHPSGKSADFGALAEAAAQITPPKDVPLKGPEDFTLIGTDLRKVDAAPKSNGTALFTIDVQRPDMLIALVAHSPRFGGKLKSYDDTEARQVKGVIDVVEIPRGVAVLARNTYAAKRGRDALKTEWDFSEAEMRGTEEIIADFTKLAEKPGATVEKKGDTAAAIAEAGQTIDANYVFPYLAHATMEPLNCTMEMTQEGKCIIRSGTQMPSVERQRVAEFLGLKEEDVQVQNLYAGGGFGRRANFVPDLEIETASILEATGRKYPIKLQYTREDDTRSGYYRPLFVHRMHGAVDDQGNITAWENRLVGQSFVVGTFLGGMVQNGLDPLAVEGSAHLPYEVPNVSVDYQMAESGVPALSWRSVGHTHTAYSKETFLDELLTAAGKDPVEGRLALMQDERAKHVIELAAEKAGWGKTPADGRARGVAYVESFSSRVAEVAEVSVSDSGRIKVEKVTVAVDCGTAVNPNIVRAQIESAIVYGLTAAMYGEVAIENGIVQTKNFDTYRMMRMNEMPKVDVHIVPSTESPTGIGEPGLPPIAPAVANAAFKLTGKRIRRLPFEPLDI